MPSPPAPDPRPDPRPAAATTRGLPFALGAYLIWGLLPLYLRLVHDVPPIEFVALRILFTLPFCLAVVLVSGSGGELRAALRNRGVLARLMLSAALICVNWLVYIFAVHSGHVLAASLGYYLNPLANVLAGTLFLGERLSRRQWAAVALAAAGVSALALASSDGGARDTLWISLILALTFSAYGLVRKLTPVAALPGLTIETMILLVPAALVAAWFGAGAHGSSFGQALGPSLLVAASGIATGLPLLLFAIAARRMEYSALGMVQFCAPTIMFLLGIFVFHESMKPAQLVSFGLIWAAIALFVWDLLSIRSKIR